MLSTPHAFLLSINRSTPSSFLSFPSTARRRCPDRAREIRPRRSTWGQLRWLEAPPHPATHSRPARLISSRSAPPRDAVFFGAGRSSAILGLTVVPSIQYISVFTESTYVITVSSERGDRLALVPIAVSPWLRRTPLCPVRHARHGGVSSAPFSFLIAEIGSGEGVGHVGAVCFARASPSARFADRSRQRRHASSLGH